MKTNHVKVLAGIAVALLVASNAMAVFVPPVGQSTFNLIDAANLYGEPTENSPNGAIGRSDYTPGVAPVGLQDVTVFRVTGGALGDGNSLSDVLPNTTVLTGIVTFLEVNSASNSEILLQDSIRPHAIGNGGVDPVSGAPLIGRFFLYEGDRTVNIDAGKFSDGTSGVVGSRPGDVVFNQVQDGYAIDTLANFTGGTLLATGNLVSQGFGPDGAPIIIESVTQIFNDQGVAIGAKINNLDVALDGGLWVANGIDRISLSIDQIGYNGDGTSFTGITNYLNSAAVDPSLTNKNASIQSVYEAGWQLSSSDPATLSRAIPEPLTAGLGSMGVLALAGYLLRRR